MSDLNPDITEDMIAKAAQVLAAREGYDWAEVSQHWQSIYRDRAEDVLGAALAGRAPADHPTRDQVWSVINRIQDAAADAGRGTASDDIIDALVAAGHLHLAGEAGDE